MGKRFNLAVLLTAMLAAQDSTTPTFRTGTRLVEVDVVVRDDKGPVKGLTKEDFTLLDKGKPQAIAIFSVRSADSKAPKPAPLPNGVVSNRLRSRGDEPVSATVVLIDRLNTAVEDQSRIRLQALKYLRAAGGDEGIALYALNKKLTVLQEFTEDRERLIRAAEKAPIETSVDLTAGDVAVADNGILLSADLTQMSQNAVANTLDNARQRRVDGTTAALETLARHLSGMPGRKKLIWISGSFPMVFTQEETHNLSTTTEHQDFSDPIDRRIQSLNAANVAVYPIDPRGPLVGLSDPNIDAEVYLASRTGGKANYGSNDIAGALEAAITDTDLTYTLGFYTNINEADGTYHSLTVKVDRPGVQIRNRLGYNDEKPLVVDDKKLRRTLNAWVQEPLESTEIGIRASAFGVPDKPGSYRVEVFVDPSELQLEQKNGRWVGLFDLAIVPDGENKPKGLLQRVKVNLTEKRLREAAVSGISVSNVVQVVDQKGKLLSDKLHIVVQDAATPKSGSVRVPITWTWAANARAPQQNTDPQPVPISERSPLGGRRGGR